MQQSCVEILESFGAAVRARRVQMGLSQEAFAHACGLDRTYVGGVERGERNISILNICKISKALRLKPSDLLKAAGR